MEKRKTINTYTSQLSLSKFLGQAVVQVGRRGHRGPLAVPEQDGRCLDVSLGRAIKASGKEDCEDHELLGIRHFETDGGLLGVGDI